MIKIDKGELIPIEFGDIKDVQVGETVVAIGTPLSLSLRNSATKGMISGLNRSIQSEYRFIQSDAAINGGNSGGPLVNMKGKVVGINSIKYTGDGIEGMSFSIPVDTVKYAINQFEKYGEIRRPYLGVSIIEGIAARYGLPSNEGITITEVKKGTPASQYGLLADDIITGIDGINITTLVDFYETMKNYLPGSSAVFSIKRNEKIIKIKIIFGSSPKNNKLNKYTNFLKPKRKGEKNEKNIFFYSMFLMIFSIYIPVSASSNPLTINFKIGSSKIFINNVQKVIPKVLFQNKTVFVPLQSILDAYGAEVIFE